MKWDQPRVCAGWGGAKRREPRNHPDQWGWRDAVTGLVRSFPLLC